MISEFEAHHGKAIIGLIRANKGPLTIAKYNSPSNASYLLNGHVAIYIKHSAKRMSPWRFSFLKEHQDEIKTLKQIYGEVYVVLVCNNDGIVALNFSELKTLLDDSHSQSEWISAARTRNTEYAIKGSDGKLNFKVAKNSFPSKLLKII
jgi:hypothetical protein